MGPKHFGLKNDIEMRKFGSMLPKHPRSKESVHSEMRISDKIELNSNIVTFELPNSPPGVKISFNVMEPITDPSSRPFPSASSEEQLQCNSFEAQ